MWVLKTGDYTQNLPPRWLSGSLAVFPDSQGLPLSGTHRSDPEQTPIPREVDVIAPLRRRRCITNRSSAGGIRHAPRGEVGLDDLFDIRGDWKLRLFRRCP